MELGITTIYVTHDQAEAMAISDRILILKDGVAQQVDSPAGIYNRPVNEFVATFVSRNNVIDAFVVKTTGTAGAELTVRADGGLILRGDPRRGNFVSPPRAGDRVKVTIRPEAVLPAGIRNRAGDGVADNLFDGTIEHAEYAGDHTSYLISVGGAFVLNASFGDTGLDARRKGEPIRVRVPASALYFLAQEEDRGSAGV